MKRPKPTKSLFIELCGGNQGLISCAHHGLFETSLKDFYSFLDLDEAFVFAASSWKSREKNKNYFSGIDNVGIYNLFSDIYNIGFAWLNKYKSISQSNLKKHSCLNPFQGKDLSSRLSHVSSSAVAKLKSGLQDSVHEYVFECQYSDRKRMRDGDNYNLEIMSFQAVYPKKGKIVPSFAAEVSRIIGSYPVDFFSK